METETEILKLGEMDPALPLSARLMAVASALAFADDTEILIVDTKLAELLAGMAREVEDDYVFADKDPENGWPTVAQGIALARFMRNTLKEGWATVSPGGLGLPDHYLHVSFNDGYTGGIAPDGRTST